LSHPLGETCSTSPKPGKGPEKRGPEGGGILLPGKDSGLKTGWEENDANHHSYDTASVNIKFPFLSYNTF